MLCPCPLSRFGGRGPFRSKEVQMYLSEQERDRRYGSEEDHEEAGVDVLCGGENHHASGSPLLHGSFRYLTDFFIFSLYGLCFSFEKTNP